MRIDETKILECQKCGKVVLRKSMNQKYCERCSEISHQEIKARYRGKNRELCNKQTIECNKKFSEKSKKHIVDIKRESDEKNRSSMFWEIDNTKIDLVFRFSVPFDFNYSKNSIWSLGRKRGHVFVRKEINLLREALANIVKTCGIKWRVNKLYLDILVQKPSLRGDAINVIDTIADSIKKSVGIDDNWFSIRRLDWEIVRDNPRIFIGIGQENEDKYPCNVCGTFKTFDHYPKDKSSRFGISTPCKECSKELRSRVRNARNGNQ